MQPGPTIIITVTGITNSCLKILFFEKMGDQVEETNAVFIGYFDEAEAYPIGGILIIKSIDIRPDYTGGNYHRLLIWSLNRYADNLIQLKWFFTNYRNTVKGDILGFAFNEVVTMIYDHGPFDFDSGMPALFTYIFQIIDFPSFPVLVVRYRISNLQRCQIFIKSCFDSESNSCVFPISILRQFAKNLEAVQNENLLKDAVSVASRVPAGLRPGDPFLKDCIRR